MLRAGFGIRLGAAAIDVAAMYLASSLAGGAVAAYFVIRKGPGAAQSFLIPMLAANGAVWVAYSLTEVFGTATPAKRLFKLRIATESAAPPTYGRLLVRWSAKYSPMVLYLAAMLNTYRWVLRPVGPQGQPPALMLVLNLLCAAAALAVLGGFFAVLSKRRQALHDVLAGTVVLRPGEEPQGFMPIMPAPPPDTRPAPGAETVVPADTSSVPTVAPPADGGGDAR